MWFDGSGGGIIPRVEIEVGFKILSRGKRHDWESFGMVEVVAFQVKRKSTRLAECNFVDGAI